MTTRPEQASTPNTDRRLPGSGKLTPEVRKPWMANRPGESDAERVERLGWTCYACGVQIRNTLALDLHQDQCNGKPPEDPGVWR